MTLSYCKWSEKDVNMFKSFSDQKIEHVTEAIKLRNLALGLAQGL